MRKKRTRPTLKALADLTRKNEQLVEDVAGVVARNQQLSGQLVEITARAQTLHTERRIAEERLAEVQVQLSDMRVLLGLPNPHAVDMLKYLRTELATKVGGGR